MDASTVRQAGQAYAAIGPRSPARPGQWAGIRKPHLLVMSAVFLGALFVAYLLLPGDNERIAALERDGKNAEAMQMLERLHARGDNSQRTLFQLQALYENFGEIEKARETLEMLAELRPGDGYVQRRLAQFYKATQDEPRYLAALQKRLSRRFSEPVCREIIGIHRSNGNFAAEETALVDCRARGYRRPDDLVRLAYLQAADGNIAEASSLLRAVDDRRRLRVDRDRLMFFTALLESGQAAEAQKRALRWFKGSRDSTFALQLIDNLAQDGKYDLAIGLARSVGVPGDSVSLAVAELMLDRDQANGAQTYLKGWLEHGRLRDREIAHRFIYAALDAEDPGLAFKAAQRYGLARLDQSELVALAEALSAVGNKDAFAQVRDAIDPHLLQDNPLLAAAIEFDRGSSEPARQLLSRVEVEGLDEWRLALWSRLMQSTGRAGAAQALRDAGILAANPAQALQPPPARIIQRRFRPPVRGRTPRYTARRRSTVRSPATNRRPQRQPAPKAKQPVGFFKGGG
ncbi:MAG: hypothetical protein R3D68_11600 [Hyphomicrobiaceae bacterium]